MSLTRVTDTVLNTVATVAALRAFEPSTEGETCYVASHTAGSTLGGGDFRAVLNGSSYTDNNGTIIKTAGGAVWIRLNADVLNPTMFGAQCTPTVSDHNAIYNMLVAGYKCDGLGKTYYLGDTVYANVIDAERHFSNANLVAMSSLPDNRPMVRMTNQQYFDRINIDGSNKLTIGILWEGGRPGAYGGISNCLIKNTGSQGIYVGCDYTTNKVAQYGYIRNITFIKCGNLGTANGRATLGLDGVADFVVEGIVASSCNWGLYFRNDLNIAGVTRKGNNRLSNVIIRGSGRTHATFTDAQGISASFQDNLQILGVTVSDFADNGIDMQYCDASIVDDWRVNNCKDGVFMGDRACRRHVISNGVAIDVDRGIRLVTDGSYTMNGSAPVLNQIKIKNVHVYNPSNVGIYLVNTGKLTYGSTMTNVQLVNCSVDATNSYTATTQTYGFQIQGGVNVSLVNCDTLNTKLHGIFVKDSEFVRIMSGTLQNVDRANAGNQGVYVDTDCSRVSVSDVSVYGSGAAGAVTLAGGSGHTAKHIRWRGVASGVTSSGATSPYLLDNITF